MFIDFIMTFSSIGHCMSTKVPKPVIQGQRIKTRKRGKYFATLHSSFVPLSNISIDSPAPPLQGVFPILGMFDNRSNKHMMYCISRYCLNGTLLQTLKYNSILVLSSRSLCRSLLFAMTDKMVEHVRHCLFCAVSVSRIPNCGEGGDTSTSCLSQPPT